MTIESEKNAPTARATLADAQPGGRVRLGDGPTIEKQARDLLAKEWEMLSFDAPVEELREGCELPPVVAASVRAIVAALSAHPFPDGQRDDSDLLAGLRDVEEHLYYAGSNPSHTETVRAAINALAARQPGGEPVADWSKRGGKPTDWRNELLTLAEHHAPIPACARSAMRVIARSMPAPPAQAVDLGAVRDAVHGISLGFNGDLPYIKGITEALALIDSKAEVSRG